MKKNIVLIALASVFVATFLLAQKRNIPLEKRWKNVQEFADKQLPESALKEVDIILNQAQKEKNQTEVIKALVYKMRFTLDKDPDEAPALIRQFEVFTDQTTDVTEKALLHSMTAELYQKYYQSNAWTVDRRKLLTGAVPDDMKEWSRNIFFDKITKHSEASLVDAAVLQQTDVLKFAALLHVGADSKTLQPTLFDFLSYRRIALLEELSRASSVINPLKDAAYFSDLSAFVAFGQDSVYRNSVESQMAETYRRLLAFRSESDNVPALLYADVQRLNYMRAHATQEGADSSYLAALDRLEKRYSNNEAVVEVLAQKAEYYWRSATGDKTNRKTAYDICSSGLKRFPHYKRINKLKNIRMQIIQKALHVEYSRVVGLSDTLKMVVGSANVRSLQLQVYRVNATAADYAAYEETNRNSKRAYPNRTLIETRVLKPNANLNFGTVNTQIGFKARDYGIYEFAIGEKNDSTASERAVGAFTVTNLAYMNRAATVGVGSLYVLNRQSGQPQKEVEVSVYKKTWTNNGYQSQLSEKQKTDKTGLCSFSLSDHRENCVFFFAKGKDCYYSSGSYLYYNEQSAGNNDDAQLTLLTDRAVYRPGQTVYFKGIAYYAQSQKQQVAAKNTGYEVTLFDANGQNVSSRKFSTNEFGSFAGEFVLPDGGLSGTYRLQSGNYSQTIRVEEYKRPSFEVSIDKPKAEVSFGNRVTLTGHVKAYAGYAVAGAGVKYRVVRRPHRYCWWFSEPDKEIATGTAATKPDGTFDVSFVPVKTASNVPGLYRDGQFYTYTLYADVTDLKGETQQGEQGLSVGDKSLFILAEIPEKINKKEKQLLNISTRTINDEVVYTTLKYTVSRLADTNVYAEKLDESVVLKEVGVVLSGSFDTRDKKLAADFSRLNSGRYKLTLTTTDSHGQEVKTEKVFVLYDTADKRPPVKSAVWMLRPKTECEVGDKAQIIFGTSTVNSYVLYEIMQGNAVLESRWIPFSDEIKSFDIPFKESYGAGVSVQFTFMKDGQLYHEVVELRHKVATKKLSPVLSVFRNKLLPGEKAEWTVTVPDSVNGKKPVELLVAMYDASLDAISPHSWSFDPSYRPMIPYSPQWSFSENNWGVGSASFPVNLEQLAELDFNDLDWFGLDISGSGGRPLMIRGMANVSRAAEDGLVLSETAVVGYGARKKNSFAGAVADMKMTAEAAAEKTPVKIRTNFNETAFFYPQLRTDAQGNVKFTFTAPESLTRWNVKMLAHTPDLYFGQSDAQVVTQKDLMVQMNLPRFVRRSDKLVLSANVINLTDKELKSTVRLELIDPATEKPIRLKDTAPKALTLAANETKAVEWELTEFSPYELVICKVAAHAGNFNDGEQKYLPVLPDKVLVTESMPLTVRGNETRTFNFESLLKHGSTVDTRNLSVEFSSNPTWYAVQALPAIATPENDNALDYFSAYYANTLATYIANANPKIAAVFDRWKNAGGTRETLLSNLQKNTELKNMLLEETPWVMAAKDETEQKRQIALLFDLNSRKNQAQQYLDKLISLQLPSGAFAWFYGMGANRYITQEIVLNLARLNKMVGGNALIAYRLLLTAALTYLDLELAHDFDLLKKSNKAYQKEMCIDNMQLFYLHMRSEYPDIPVADSARQALKFYTVQSEKYWTGFTLYGKAMTAVLAQRNGKSELAADILKSLKENAMKTDELGMYWAKNKPGYYWNERPIAVQAALIGAFSELSGSQTDLDEMKIWLLKQKQTQRWDSPLSTVDAVYALLHQGADWLANDGVAQIKLGSALLKPETVEAGTSYFKQSIAPVDVRPEMGKVTVSNTNHSGIGWGAMYWQYYLSLDKVTGQGGPLKITRNLFVVKPSVKGSAFGSALNGLVPVEQAGLYKGDKVVSRLVITTDRNLEFVALKDLRASCFEPVSQRSGSEWKEGVCYYQSTKDASTQFFFSFLPKGTYVFEYEMWVNASGDYSSGIASVQCQYAPEFVAHTGGEKLSVK
jgi:hypothetical protein